jgi:tRNA nucleotidyltransferase (CCA-adding enzyme)
MTELLSTYGHFLETCESLGLLEAYNFKPLLDGKQLSAALNTPPGIWTKHALDVVMAWQLRNPNVTDTDTVLEEVRAWKQAANTEGPPKKKTKTQGELSSVLSSHFLRLTLRPIFTQTPNNPNLTATGRRDINANLKRQNHSNIFNDEIRPWKNKDAWALDILNWVCKNLDEQFVEEEWGVLIPPILTILDDTEVDIKARGCGYVQDLLEKTPPHILKRTGLTPVFEESLIACTSYLPNLTAEKDSIIILNAAYPALFALANTAYPPVTPPAHSPERTKFLVNVLRKGILAGYKHAGEKVRIAQTLLIHLPTLINALGIDSVAHLKDTISLLSNLLSDPFASASPSLLSTALTSYKAVISNGWPRIGYWRGDVLRGLCTLWVRILEEEDQEQFQDIKMQLKDIMYGLNAAVTANSEFKTQWPSELKQLLDADEDLHGLFSDVI